MRRYVGNTDHDWFTFLRSIEPAIDEVNFSWPGESSFRALLPGAPFFFKLKSPFNAIAGFGYFAHFSILPVSLAWDVYGIGNGARSFAEMRKRLSSIRSRFGMDTDPKQDFRIGCILVNQPLFFEEGDFVRVPDDRAGNIGPEAIGVRRVSLTDLL